MHAGAQHGAADNAPVPLHDGGQNALALGEAVAHAPLEQRAHAPQDRALLPATHSRQQKHARARAGTCMHALDDAQRIVVLFVAIKVARGSG